MRSIRAFLLRLGGLFHRERRDRELADEIESNLQLHIEDNLRAGMSPEDARRDALLKFGGIESAKEAYRDRRGLPLFEALAQEIRYAFRQIGKYPGVVAIVVLTLGLGTGATTAIFSVVNTVLLRPLPYRDPSHLVWVTERFALSFTPGAVFGPDYLAWRRENSSFEEIEGFGGGAPDTSLDSKGTPIAVRATSVTPRFFSMLGVNPILGRSFTDAEGSASQFLQHWSAALFLLWSPRARPLLLPLAPGHVRLSAVVMAALFRFGMRVANIRCLLFAAMKSAQIIFAL